MVLHYVPRGKGRRKAEGRGKGVKERGRGNQDGEGAEISRVPALVDQYKPRYADCTCMESNCILLENSLHTLL